MTKRILAMALCLMATSAWCQLPLKTHTLNTDDGLPSNYIINMVQDPQGYVWMATSDGLCRYDGYSFDIHRHDPHSNDSLLLSNRVRELHQNPNGLLFVRLQGEQYSCYDTHRRQFVPFIPDGKNHKNYCDCAFMPDNTTWLWYDYSGCIEVTYRDGIVSSREYNKENGLLRSNNVRFVEADSHGRVWVGTQEGLYLKQGEQLRLIDGKTGFIAMAELKGTTYFATTDHRIMHAESDVTLTADVSNWPGWDTSNRLRGVVPLNDQLLVITDSQTYSYDPQRHQVNIGSMQIPGGTVRRDNMGRYYVADRSVVIYYFDTQRGETYTFSILDSKLLSKRGITPYEVLTDHDGNIWISTLGNGLFIFDPTTHTLEHHSPKMSARPPIQTDYLYGMMADRSGNIWLSQENMGISVVTAMPRSVRRLTATNSLSPDYANLFRSLHQTADGRVWAGNFMGGAFLLENNKLLPAQLGIGDDLLSICIDSRGQQWVGTRSNGVYVDGHHYAHHADDPTSLASGKVFDILCDRQGRVWVGVNMGALCLAETQPDGTYRFRHFLDDQPLMRNITTLIQTKAGHVFAGCGNGIVVFDPEQIIRDPKAYHYYTADNSSLGYFEIRDLFEDREGTVWLASAGGGLYRVENPSEVNHLNFKRYTTDQGLADNTVNSIIADQKGLLWIGTHYGLSRLDTHTMRFTTYYLSADKLGDVYSENSSCMLKDGTLVFGTNNGVVCFNPDQMQDHQMGDSHLAITSLLVNGIPYREGETDGRLRLTHRQNSLTFRFSDLDFGYPHNTEYVYWLEGADRGWSLPTRQNEAVYKDLVPGSYVFHVRRADDQKEVVMKVLIRQPWWNTWWAWLIYLTLFGALAWYMGRLLFITYSMRNRIRMDKEISEFKHRFFMDVSHEFRTPLTLILGSMERIRKTGDLPAAIRQPIANMGRSADRLKRLVNQLLEFDKQQHGKLSLRLQLTDVVKFLRDLTMGFSDMAYNKEMNLQFVPFAQHEEIYVDRSFLDKIVYNLLSNAFKYTPRKGDVTVRVKKDDSHLLVRVEDTGIGVPREKQPQLFTRFMQTNVVADSMGIGLHFTAQLVKAHHGTIRYEENPQGGSVFEVGIPLSADGYQPEDFMEGNSLEEEMPHDDRLRHYREVTAEPLNDRTVLIVEDDEDVREYLRNEMAAYFNVVTAQDGAEALTLIGEGKAADLVVSDIRMPVMDGIELLKRVRADDDLFDIPFILLSAITTIEKQLEGARFGADAYIAKPFSPALLIGKSISLIRQRDKLKAAYGSKGKDSKGIANEGSTGDVTPSSASADNAPLLTSERDRKFRDIVDIKIAHEMDNPNFMVDDLAQSTGYGRSQFYSKMMEVTGKTPKDYIRMKRMARAAELLHSGEMITVAEVAYKVGFSDSLYFSRCFKQYFGVTPSKYMKDEK